MKNLFPHFNASRAIDYAHIWSTAIFVFDTNVLLDLYRYRASARSDLLSVLKQLRERIWLPHHVALEYQRNRLKVIADQNGRLSEVRRAIEKAESSLNAEIERLQLNQRYSLIDPEPLTAGMAKLTADFFSTLAEVQEAQPKLTGADNIKDELEFLFDGRVGPAPADQKSIDALYSEADLRFRAGIPPGYRDIQKDKAGNSAIGDEHVFGGVKYKRKYADYLIWSQLLAHAKTNTIHAVVFVTDDAKDDWWWRFHSGGPKTVGPRPELLEEAHRVGGVDTFIMYRPAEFLGHARQHIGTKVSEQTLSEVRDISLQRDVSDSLTRFQFFALNVERAVHDWLRAAYGNVRTSPHRFPDFIVDGGGPPTGFDVKYVYRRFATHSQIRDFLRKATPLVLAGELTRVTLVLAFSSLSLAQSTAESVRRIVDNGAYGILNSEAYYVTIGTVAPTPEGPITFTAIADISLATRTESHA